MIRILHTADWHLGKRLGSFDRLEEQVKVLHEVEEIVEQRSVDLIVIAGDIFDQFNPPVTAVDLFYQTVKRLSKNGERPVVIISGNHDSPERIDAPDPLAQACGIVFMGSTTKTLPTINLDSGVKIKGIDEWVLEVDIPNKPVTRIIMTPFVNEFRLKKYLGEHNTEQELRTVLESKWNELADKHFKEDTCNLVMSHLFVSPSEDEPEEEEGDDEKSILYVGGTQIIFPQNFPDKAQYIALGHLHRCHAVVKSDKKIWYSGSPLAYSFAEEQQEKFVLLLEAVPNEKIVPQKIALTEGKTLVKKKFSDISLCLNWLEENQNTWVELTLISETYISAQTRKQLHESHPGIINIIPIMGKEEEKVINDKLPDLQLSMDELFVSYFKSTHDIEPSKEVMNLFKELKGLEAE